MSLYSQTILQDSPLAYWRLGELSGTAAADSSGNGRSGTYHACTLGVAGAIAGENNAAASFDGSSAYVDCPSLSVGSVFSIEAWGYKTSTAAATIAAQGDSTSTSVSFFFRINSASGFTTAPSSYQSIALPDVALNAWHHHVLTYDGAHFRYYLDGALTTSGAASGTPQSLTNHTILGRLGDDPLQFWPGFLDEVAIYNIALSASRITAHYQAALAAGLTAPPVGNCPMIRGCP